jgi:hypothetical protein
MKEEGGRMKGERGGVRSQKLEVRSQESEKGVRNKRKRLETPTFRFVWRGFLWGPVPPRLGFS